MGFKRRSRDITTRYSVPPPANITHTRLTTAQDLIHLAHELKIESFCLHYHYYYYYYLSLTKFAEISVTNSQTTLIRETEYVTKAFTFSTPYDCDDGLLPSALSCGSTILGLPTLILKVISTRMGRIHSTGEGF